MSNRVLLLLSSLALLATGCVRETFALPMTAAELARVGSGPALVAYLGQRDATPAVCDARSAGPHLARFDDEVRDALVDGLVDGHVDPDLWRRCAKGFLRSAPPEASASLLDAIGAAYERLVKRSDFETSPARQAAVAAMQRLYLERDHGTDGHAGELDPRFSDLRRAIAEKRIGAVAARFGAELLVAVDLEHGLYEGQPVDGATIDRLYAAGDERALHLFADRLPRADLRDEARRRIVRIHVAKSPFPEVRAAAAAYEELVMRQGNAPVSLTEHAPGRAWIDTGPLPARGVLVRQDVLRGTAKLLAWSGAPGVSVVPEVPLRGALYVEVAGVSRPITVCAPPKDLDTSPCVAARDLASEQPAAYVDARGALHFVEHVPTQAVLDLAAAGPRLATPIRVGASARAPLVWPLWFERPGDLVFRGQGAGSRGPALSVLVDRHNPERLVFSLRVGAASYAAVVEGRDVAAFHIASRGADGAAGTSGSDGMDGSDGGECQTGGDGGDGSDGGSGGDGGDGGDVAVRIACGGAPCGDAAALFSQTITSQGGAGGPGGAGGRGGRGGSGGPAGPDNVTTNADGTTTTTPGCSAGSSGSAGRDGSTGPSGNDGKPGRVTIAVDG